MMIHLFTSSLTAIRTFGKKMATISENVAKSSGAVFTNPGTSEGVPPTDGKAVSKYQGGPLTQTASQDIPHIELEKEICACLLTRRYHAANIEMLKESDEMVGTILDIVK